MIAAREFLRLGLDDLLIVAREFLNPRLSRSALHRMLKRREVQTLTELARQDAGDDHQPRHKPFKIQTVLTDNGKSFTDRFTREGERRSSGRHPFDQVCQKKGIEHHLIKPGRPQSNGMVERFNGRMSDVLATRRYEWQGFGANTEALQLALQSPYPPESAVASVTDLSDNKDDKLSAPSYLING